MIINDLLLQQGYIISKIQLPEFIEEYVISENWKSLDDFFLKELNIEGDFYKFLRNFAHFNHTEHIISLRQGPDDEDGIWHDDGSRHFGYSLSLNRFPSSISGGELLFRKKNSLKAQSFGPLQYGEIVLFLSGLYNYEHKVNAVKQGERLVIAGWCS